MQENQQFHIHSQQVCRDNSRTCQEVLVLKVSKHVPFDYNFLTTVDIFLFNEVVNVCNTMKKK